MTLDELFLWASQQIQQFPHNTVSVGFAMTTNDPKQRNLVTYSEGRLTYSPGSHRGVFFSPPSFSSGENTIVQYFSNQTYPCDRQALSGSPFDCHKTEPLTVSITRALIVMPTVAPYTVVVKSTHLGTQTRVLASDRSFDCRVDRRVGYWIFNHQPLRLDVQASVMKVLVELQPGTCQQERGRCYGRKTAAFPAIAMSNSS